MTLFFLLAFSDLRGDWIIDPEWKLFVRDEKLGVEQHICRGWYLHIENNRFILITSYLLKYPLSSHELMSISSGDGFVYWAGPVSRDPSGWVVLTVEDSSRWMFEHELSSLTLEIDGPFLVSPELVFRPYGG